MNQNIVESFIKKAQDAGLTKEQAEQFLVANFPGYKTAEQQLGSIIGGILTAAGVENNEKTAAYVEGFLKEAITKGATDEQAIELAKRACDAKCKAKQFPPIPNNTKKAEANTESTDNAKLAYYAEGFMKRAQEVGLTEGQSLDLLKVAISNAKQAMDPSMMAGAMGGGMGGGAPAPGPEAGGGLDIQALLAQLLGQGGEQGGQEGLGGMNPEMFHQMMGGMGGGQGQPAMAAPGQ